MNNIQFQIWESDKKSFRRSILILILALLVVLPIFINLMRLDLTSKENLIYSLKNLFLSIAPYFSIIITPPLIIILEIIFRKNKD